MTLTRQLINAVELSSADDGAKAIAITFLNRAAPIIEGLGPGIFQEVLRVLSGGAGAGAFTQAVIGRLNQDQVLTLLRATGNRMGELAELHEAQLAARAAALETLKNVSLTILARVVLAML